MSRQFNFSLDVKINNIEFEGNFLMKPLRMQKEILLEDC